MADNQAAPAADNAVTPGAPAVADDFSNLDDNLNPIGQDNMVEEETVEEADDQEEVEQQEETTDEEQTDSEQETEEENKDEEDGYSIDEDDEESELPADKAAAETPAVTPEGQYILDGVKDYAITVRGTVGKSEEIKEFKVLSPEQLPNGFQYIDGREQAIANKGFSMLEGRARELQQQYQQEQQQKQLQDFNEREQNADRRDIAALQKRGDIPLFKAKVDDKNFEDDPGVKMVQDVLDFKDKRNAQYMEEYNAGRPYKHIGFEEAFELFSKQNPSKSNAAQVKEDKARKELASRTAKSRGNGATTSKREVHTGMTSRDLDNYIESLADTL
jgi:hypothetical protein